MSNTPDINTRAQALNEHGVSKKDETLASSAFELIQQSHENISVLTDAHVAYRTPDRNKVSLFGSSELGQEPANLGLIGNGMLTGTVSVPMASAPSTKQIEAGLEAVRSPKGVIVILSCTNRSIMNFGLTIERYGTLHQEPCEAVFVSDDVMSTTNPSLSHAKGLAGFVMVSKVAGAASDMRYSYDDVLSTAQMVADHVASVGVSVDLVNRSLRERAIHPEAQFKPEWRDSTQQMQFRGMQGLVEKTIRSIVGSTKSLFAAEDQVAVLVNSNRLLSDTDLYSFANMFCKSLGQVAVLRVQRLYVGHFFSLAESAFTVSVLNLTKCEDPVEDTLKLLDYPTQAPCWAGVRYNMSIPTSPVRVQTTIARAPISSNIMTMRERCGNMIFRACKALIKAEPMISQIDAALGDGDCGKSLAGGARAVLSALKEGRISLEDIVLTLDQLSFIVEGSVKGKIGSIAATFLSAYAKGALEFQGDTYAGTGYALNRTASYTKARIGQKTLMDALIPFVASLNTARDFAEAVEAAETAAEKTSNLPDPRVTVEVPDPGAIAVAILARGLLDGTQGF